jgi:tRNA(Ile)-lysidine synthase
MSLTHSRTRKTGEKTLMADPLIVQAFQTIGRHGMLHSGDKVLVGVSAGPDSVVLLHLLHALADRLSIRLGTAHLDHGLRPEAAEAENNLVHALGRQMGINCHTGKLGVIPRQGSLEEQLRKQRYAFFRRTAFEHGYTRLALGHHADDNAEAVLLHLLRGSGLRGLSGIPPVREHWIIRPLIETRRSEILAYAERHNLAYLLDASNLDPRFARNKIRHRLIPLLENQYNPNLVGTLNRTAALCREEEQWHAAHADSLVKKMMHHIDPHRLEIRIAPLIAVHRALQRHLIRSALGQWQGHLRRISSGHIEALLSLLAASRPGGRRHLPLNVVAETTDELICFRRVDNARQDHPLPATKYAYTISALGPAPWELRISEAASVIRFSAISPGPTENWQAPEDRMILLDMDQLTFPLTVRSFIEGDHFQPFGLHGRQKVKKLFIDRKIPRPLRQRIPLLTSGGTILWVVGVRRAHSAAVSSETKRVLRVEVEKR